VDLNITAIYIRKDRSSSRKGWLNRKILKLIVSNLIFIVLFFLSADTQQIVHSKCTKKRFIFRDYRELITIALSSSFQVTATSYDIIYISSRQDGVNNIIIAFYIAVFIKKFIESNKSIKININSVKKSTINKTTTV
jgi:hypothetical protein